MKSILIVPKVVRIMTDHGIDCHMGDVAIALYQG